MTAPHRPTAFRQTGIRQRSLRKHCRLGRATELVLVLATGAVLVLGDAAQAQTWTGNGPNDFWSTFHNWDTNMHPVPSSTAVIDGTGQREGPFVLNPASAAQTNVSGGYLIVASTLTSPVTVSNRGALGIDSMGEIVGNIVFGSSESGENEGTITGTLSVTSGRFINRFSARVFGSATVSGGTLTMAPNAQIVGNVTVQNGGILQLQGNNNVTGTIFTTGSVIDYADGINNAVPIVIASDTTQLQVTTGTATQTGVISESGGMRPLEKIGAGTLILAGANSYTGATTVSAGTLQVANATALGTAGAGTTVADGATLALSGGLTTAEALTLNGTGVSGGGALRNVSGANAVSGAITLGSDARINSDAGSLTLGGGVTGNFGLTLGGAGNITISSVIATGAGTLTKDGGGIVLLTGASTYTGDTTVNGSTLRISDTGSITSDVSVAATGTLDLNRGTITGNVTNIGTLFLSGTLNGNLTQNAGSMTIDDGGTLGSATTTVTGTVAINGGSLSVGFGHTLDASAGGIILGDGVGNAGGDVMTIDGSTLGNITVNADGRVIVNGGAAIGDTAIVNLLQGALQLNANETIGGLAGVGAGGVQLGANTLTIAGSGDNSYSGIIAGTGGLTMSGPGTQTLTGANTFTGAVEVSGGTLAVTGSGTLATTTSQILVEGGGTLQTDGGALAAGVTVILTNAGSTVRLTGNETVTGFSTGLGTTLNLDGGTLTITGNPTLAGTVTGTGGITASGVGANVLLSGTNTYSGATTISNGGRLRVTNGAAINDSGAVTVETASTFELMSSETIGTLSGAGVVALNANTLTVAGDGSTTFSGVIGGGGGLTKAGTGTLTLSGDNTYSGTTNVNAGTLVAGSNSAFGAGDVLLLGGTLSGQGDRVLNNRLSARDNSDTTIAAPGGNRLELGTVNPSGNNAIIRFGRAGDSGTVVVNNSSGSISTASVIVEAGTLEIGVGNAGAGLLHLVASTTVTTDATLDIAGGDTTVSSLLGTGAVTNSGGTDRVLTVGGMVSGQNSTFGGVISDGETNSTALTVGASHAFTLTGANIYTGATIVSNGTLAVTGSGTLASTALSTLANGRLSTDGGALAAGAAITNGGIFTTTGTESISWISGAGAVFLDGAGSGLTLNSGASTITGVMSGAGALTIAGGTVAMTNAANTRTGATTITSGSLVVQGGDALGDTAAVTLSGGVLELGANETIGTLSATGGTITLNANTLTVNGTTAADIAAAVNGGGGSRLVKNGAGEMTLSGVVSLGGITVNNGALILSHSANSIGEIIVTGMGPTEATLTIATTGAAGGAHIRTQGSVINYLDGVTNASTITIESNTTQLNVTDAGARATQSGAIGEDASPRGFTKTGDGTLILTGANTYSGTTTISAGTLQVGAGGTTGTLGNGTGGVTNNAALVFNRSDETTVGNAISGTGSVTQGGTGTTILTGTNSYTGTTTVSAGTLQIGDGGTTGTLGNGTGGVTNNAALVFNRSDETTVGNAISGTGSVTAAGAGLLVFTGNNSYTGPTTINAGSLQIGDGGTMGSLGSGAVTNNGSLAFMRSDSVTISNAISGSGTLTQGGTGTTILTGTNSYTGTTSVISGTLAVTGGAALADTGAVSVAAGATLRVDQSETIGTLTNRGTVDLSTGNGTADTVLTVNGTYVAGSVLRIDTMLGDDSAMSDRVVIAGGTSGTTAVIVNVLGGAGAQTTQGILVVDVGGASDGAFVLANGDTSLPDGAAAITSEGGVFLYALRQSGGSWFLQSQLSPVSAVYEALPATLLGLMQSQTLAQRLAGRRMLSGGSGGGNGVTLSSRGRIPATPEMGVWLDIRAAQLNVTPATSTTTGLSWNQQSRHIQAGIDTILHEAMEGVLIGGISLAAGSGQTDVTSAIGVGRIDTDSIGIGLTATWHGTGGFYADVELGWQSLESNVAPPGIGVAATKVGGTGRSVSVEIGQSFAMGEVTLIPQAELNWSKLRLDGYTGAGGLAVAPSEIESRKLRLGLAAERKWHTANGTIAQVYGIGSVNREFAGTTNVVLAGTPISASMPDWTADLGGGGAIRWQEGRRETALYGEITATRGISSGGVSGLSGKLGMRVAW
jgi:fibronectin-binding autotransporter adhesin